MARQYLCQRSELGFFTQLAELCDGHWLRTDRLQPQDPLPLKQLCIVIFFIVTRL